VYVPENPTYPIDANLIKEVSDGIVLKQKILILSISFFFSKNKTKISSGIIPNQKKQLL
jgi:hypothetical protein